MSSLQSLVIGVVSGILTSALIFLAVQIFRKIVIPWYQEIVYQGLDISGEWRVTFSQSVSQEILLNLSQKAYRITGTATFHKKQGATTPVDSIKTLELQGKISNRFVVLNLQQIDKSRIGFSTALFEVVGDGQKMIGGWTSYEVVQSKIYALECTALRTSSLEAKLLDASPRQSNIGMHPTPQHDASHES